MSRQRKEKKMQNNANDGSDLLSRFEPYAARLDEALQAGPDKVVDWVSDYLAAGGLGAAFAQRRMIYNKLARAGYDEDAGVGKPIHVLHKNQRELGKMIIGQAMKTLNEPEARDDDETISIVQAFNERIQQWKKVPETVQKMKSVQKAATVRVAPHITTLSDAVQGGQDRVIAWLGGFIAAGGFSASETQRRSVYRELRAAGYSKSPDAVAMEPEVRASYKDLVGDILVSQALRVLAQPVSPTMTEVKLLSWFGMMVEEHENSPLPQSGLPRPKPRKIK